MTLNKFEIGLLKLVAKLGLCGEKSIHKETTDTLQEVQKDLGELNNRGYVLHANKQWTITDKGHAAIHSTPEPKVKAQIFAIVEKHQPITFEDINKFSQLGDHSLVKTNLNQLIEERTLLFTKGEGYRIFTAEDGINEALSGLEKQLSVEPVLLNPVEQYETKCAVLNELSRLLDPSIASVLEDIKGDVTHLHEKAA